MTIPTSEPAGFVAGDSVRWTRIAINSEGTQLDPADSWVLTYELRNRDVSITLTATDNGDGAHLVSLAAATTADYAPGIYAWNAYATLSVDRWLIDSGSFCIEPDLAAATVLEAESWARRVLEKIESVLEGKADQDVASYSIAGRSIAKIPFPELYDIRRRLELEVQREEQAAAIKRGAPHRGIVRVRI